MIAAGEVRGAAAAALGRPVAEVTWQATPIDAALRLHSVTAGVLRVRGSADGAPFAAVLKQTRLGPDPDPAAMWVSGAEPGHRNYWKREWLAYASGLLAGLPGRLRAPRLLLATEPTPDTAWLWLEDVPGTPGSAWDIAGYPAAARDLGTTQGPFAAGSTALPADPWLSRHWLAAWTQAADRWWPAIEDDGPVERAVAALRGRAQAVWAERLSLLAIAEAAPPTVVHLDFWPSNLIAATDGRTVAVDWSSVGIGTLAQDLDQLTLDPVWMQVLPGADLDALERVVLSAYAEGLRAAGLDVADAAVRRWYAAVAGLRYTSVYALLHDLVRDPAKGAAAERRWSRPLPMIVADRVRVVERALALAEEALAQERLSG